jgi:hypothetical protein
MSAPTYVNDTRSCEVALPYLGEGVQPCALELGQHEKLVAQCNKPIVRPSKAGRRALVGASRVQVPLRNCATSTSRARCRSKKESVRIPSLRRFDISREQDGEVRGFIPVYINRFVKHIRTAISKA